MHITSHRLTQSLKDLPNFSQRSPNLSPNLSQMYLTSNRVTLSLTDSPNLSQNQPTSNKLTQSLIDSPNLSPVWNALPDGVKTQESLNCFKNAYDNYMS